MSSFTEEQIGEITRAFIDSTLWTGILWVGDDGEPADGVVDVDDIPARLLEDMRAEVRDFLDMVADSLTAGTVARYLEAVGGDVSYIGHDLALTRGGHGAGFWDRGAGVAGDRLTELAHSMRGEGLSLSPTEDGDTADYVSAGYVWVWS